jgi:hypothetical protein
MAESRRRRLVRQLVDRSAMARGVIVLDADLTGLTPALREANIKVVEIPPGTKDTLVVRNYLFHRVVVTRNTKDFLEDAPIHEYGIISLEGLTFIDMSPSFAENRTARLISQEISKKKLWSKGARFLLELRDDGKHRLSFLE